MWGSDQAASVEPVGLQRMVRNVRDIERSLGDGVKRVYDSELAARRKLRRVPDSSTELNEPVIEVELEPLPVLEPGFADLSLASGSNGNSNGKVQI
jgi:hypothetical protein